MITPRLTVAAVIERNGRFLMVEERVDGRLVLNQPAGHLEYGEDIAEAAVRETAEETGWRLIPEAVVGLYLWRVPGATTHILRTLVCGGAEAPAGDPVLDTDVVATHWLDYAAVRDREKVLRSPLVLRGIEDYLAGHRHPLDLLHRLPADEVA